MSRVVRIPDLLRAAVVLDRRTPTEIAVMTGIKVSRVTRVLTGRTAPRGDEPARILAVCGVDPSVVTTPRLGGPGVLPAGTALELMLDRLPHTGRDADARSCGLRVDFLSLTFDADRVEMLGIARDAGEPYEAKLKARTKPRRPFYRYDYWCRGVRVQHGPCGRNKHERRSSRIEFNPARVNGRGWRVVRRVLALATRIRVTRLDIAADLPISLHRLQVIPHDTRSDSKLRLYVGRHGVETIYAGPRDRVVRIYDKRRQLIEKGLAGEDHPEQTRIEAQLRGPRIAISELAGLRDPFTKLAFVVSSEGLPFPLARCAAWACMYGVQALRSLVSPSEFAAVAKHVSQSDVTHPSRVFADEWPAVASELLRKLGVASTPTTKSRWTAS